jgi:hypothetical protein
MAIKLTGVRSLQNKLERIAFDLATDAERILRERPEQAHVADALDVAVKKLRKAALSCTTQ